MKRMRQPRRWPSSAARSAFWKAKILVQLCENPSLGVKGDAVFRERWLPMARSVEGHDLRVALNRMQHPAYAMLTHGSAPVGPLRTGGGRAVPRPVPGSRPCGARSGDKHSEAT